MLGSWNLIAGFLMEKQLTHVVVFFPSYAPFWSFAPFKNGIEILLARYLKNYLSQGLDIWYTEWGWRVDYLINFWANSYMP